MMDPQSPPVPPAVSYRDVSYRYPGEPSLALEGVTLDVRQGERLGILGPNGGGKSTLLKITLGLIPKGGAAGWSGAVTVFGLDPAEACRNGIVGYVPQRTEAELAFPLSVSDVVTMPAAWRLSPFRAPPPDVRERVRGALSLVGMESDGDRPIGGLSGGQLQRVMIARAIAAGARLLALDEPTVGIDARGQHLFAELLADIHRRLGLTILIVSHDLRVIAAGCDRVACLARRLHSHTSPRGLTPAVLAELFSHNLEGVLGDAVHVDAHAASECAAHGHPPISAPHVPGPACEHGR
ncbi:MAG: metal ABC transporter ATP-binding protein [Phycisphaerae bacterium]|nr:metal ABC transporter ATP-binding protein [Phycisphaerae bacterium]